MVLDLKVIARTFETDTKISDEDLFVFGGKMAGICYMPEDYFDSKIQNEDSATKKANLTSASGHHSVFDHAAITFQISGLPKIMAMLLNSTEQYTTSEKSARYTVMKPETQLEIDTYNKWRDKFEKVIQDKYGSDIDDKTRSKLALENARYMISVFTPTHMAWTTTYRQVAYTIEWLDKLQAKCSQIQGEFNQKIAYWCGELSKSFKSEVGSYKHLKDNKNRSIEFFAIQSFNEKLPDEEIIGDVYQTSYLASFAELAQLERHRTIHYEMEFSGKDAGEFGAYIPPIIRDTELEKEWLDDFNSLKYCYPQCTLVKVLEQGRAVKFFEKSKERLCGRAQLEIMQNTIETMNKFIANRDKLSPIVANALESVTHDGNVCTKCMMKNINCQEKCMWGATKSLDRLI